MQWMYLSTNLCIVINLYINFWWWNCCVKENVCAFKLFNYITKWPPKMLHQLHTHQQHAVAPVSPYLHQDSVLSPARSWLWTPVCIPTMSTVNFFPFLFRRLLNLLNIYLKPAGSGRRRRKLSPKISHQPKLSLSCLLEELNENPNEIPKCTRVGSQ